MTEVPTPESTQYSIVGTNELISVLCHSHSYHITLLDTLKTLETVMKKGQTRFYKGSVSELLLP